MIEPCAQTFSPERFSRKKSRQQEERAGSFLPQRIPPAIGLRSSCCRAREPDRSRSRASRVFTARVTARDLHPQRDAAGRGPGAGARLLPRRARVRGPSATSTWAAARGGSRSRRRVAGDHRAGARPAAACRRGSGSGVRAHRPAARDAAARRGRRRRRRRSARRTPPRCSPSATPTATRSCSSRCRGTEVLPGVRARRRHPARVAALASRSSRFGDAGDSDRDAKRAARAEGGHARAVSEAAVTLVPWSPPSIAATGRRPSPSSSGRRTSPIRCAPRCAPTGSTTPTCSAAPAAAARRPRRASSPAA